jgi:hypothetical protein
MRWSIGRFSGFQIMSTDAIEQENHPVNRSLLGRGKIGAARQLGCRLTKLGAPPEIKIYQVEGVCLPLLLRFLLSVIPVGSAHAEG